MKTFTIKQLFPKMPTEERDRIGIEVSDFFRSLNNGKYPEKVKEKHNDCMVPVCSYPFELDGFDFKRYVELKFGR